MKRFGYAEEESLNEKEIEQEFKHSAIIVYSGTFFRTSSFCKVSIR